MVEITPHPDATDLAFPRSIAIAGAWGYIGRKFLEVALEHGLQTYVFDPGPVPPDVELSGITRMTDEAAIYQCDAEVFHLATHPEHRRIDRLLDRREPLLILNEKPMASPEQPEECRRIVDAVARSPAIMLYDFPELFDPLTGRILHRLRSYGDVRLTKVFVQRSKDREDPSNRRNDKRIVPIQYQEAVHCLAFILNLLGAVKGGVRNALGDGLKVWAQSEPYIPPNPEAYAYVVDGRCRFRLSIGGVAVEGLTDFKRNAPWAKRRIIRGIGDGRPFEIDVSYLEGKKHLVFDGVEQPCDANASSYEHVLSTAVRWSREVARPELMSGLYPNPVFARATYQLSSALWRSSRFGSEIAFASVDDLEAWDAGFAAEAPSFPRYPRG
jgi:hypothetical protein